RQPLQSTCSRASAASTWSPLMSSPAGPPSGPANRDCAPNRATATAALAAQPPLTTKKSRACTLPSGRGKRSTRNTSSSTMMPAHRSAGRGGSVSNLVLHPGADDVISDRHGRRRAQAIGMAPLQHRDDLVAVEPAGIVELGAIDHDLIRARLGVAADHQRG